MLYEVITAESAAALDHPFICKIYETGQTETDQDFIAMEFVEGQTLKEKLADGIMDDRITSYNVCYTKLLRRRNTEDRKMLTRNKFGSYCWHTVFLRSTVFREPLLHHRWQ